MELKLAKNENVIKSWDYAMAKGLMTKKSRKMTANLTLTNKRVVNTISNDISLKRTELPVDSIKTVDGNYAKNPILFATIKLVLGILLTVCIVGILFKGFSIKWIKSAWETIKGCYFELTLITSGAEGTSVTLGATRGVLKVNKFKVSVDKTVAKEILDEIGAAIYDTKAE